MVNEERTKRYSWGVEATTSLFLEGGLLVVCNRYSPWSGMPFFAFVNPGMGLSFRLRNADRIYLGLRYQYMWRYLYPYRLYSHNLTFKFGYRF